MAEKRQRASQENVEVQKSKELTDEDEKRPSNVLWKSRQTKPLKTGTGENCYDKNRVMVLKTNS